MRKYLYLALVGAMALASCRKDDMAEPKVQPQGETTSPQGAVVHFSMQADAETFVASDEVALRSMSLLSGGSTTNGFVRYTESENNQGVFYFRRKGSSTTTARILKYSIKPKDNGRKADLKVEQQELTLDGGESFSSGEWYVSAVLGLGTRVSNDTPEFTGLGQVGNNGVKHVNWLDKNGTETIPMDVPLLLGWTKMDRPTSTLNHLSVGAKSKVVVRPAGALVKIRPQSEIVDDIKVYGLTLYAGDEVAFRGNFSAPTTFLGANGQVQLGAMPHFTAPTESGLRRMDYLMNTSADLSSIEMLELPSGVRSDKHIYVWLMPYKYGNSTTQQAARLEWLCAGSPASSLDAGGDSFSLPVYTAQRSVAQFLRPAAGVKFESGKYYFSFVGVKSDLMITEFHSYPNAQANACAVELYNPTLETINLGDYALGRAEVADDNQYYLYPRDVTVNRDNQSEKINGNNFGILQPLDFKDEVDTLRWGTGATLGFLGLSATLNKKGSWYKWAISLKHQWVRAMKDISSVNVKPNPITGYDKPFNSREGLDNPTLGPGQTAIIASKGYIYNEKSSLLWINTGSWSDAIGPQAEYAYGKGYCKYIVGVKSAIQESGTNPECVTDFRVYEGGPVLFRRMPDGKKALIDVNVPFLDGDRQSFLGMFNRNIKLGDKHFRTRKGGICFPSSRFNASQWMLSKNTSSGWYNISHEANMGMRSYPLPNLGNWSQAYTGTGKGSETAKANWAQVPQWTAKTYKYNKSDRADR